MKCTTFARAKVESKASWLLQKLQAECCQVPYLYYLKWCCQLEIHNTDVDADDVPFADAGADAVHDGVADADAVADADHQDGAWVENKGIVLAFHHEAWKDKVQKFISSSRFNSTI